jgi:hypothetical protein
VTNQKDWSVRFRADTRQFELHCPHGIGHPENMGKHGCDGCCRQLSLEAIQALKDEYQNPDKASNGQAR